MYLQSIHFFVCLLISFISGIPLHDAVELQFVSTHIYTLAYKRTFTIQICMRVYLQHIFKFREVDQHWNGLISTESRENGKLMGRLIVLQLARSTTARL